MNMEPSGTGRLVVSLATIGLLAIAVRLTMEGGKYQQFTWLLLGFFALRVVLGWVSSSKMGAATTITDRDRLDV